MKKVTGNKEKSDFRINLEENWKVYLIYAAVAIAFVVWILSSRSSSDTPEDREYLEELESTDYIAYTSYSGDLTSYLRLSASYEEAGYEGTDEVITLFPADAEVTAQDEDALQDAANALQTGIVDYDGEALYLAEDVDAVWTFTVEEAGLYSIVLDYAGVDGDGSDIRRAFYIDGEAYCEEATSVRFYRYYIESGEVTVNAIGDEVWPTQEEVVCWQTQAAYDSAGYDPEPMYFYLEAGTHTLQVAYVDQPVAIKEIRLEGKQEIPTYEEVLAEYEANGYEEASSGSGMYLEAEESTWRNDSIIRRESNNDPKTSPFSLTTRVLNTVGGSRWSDGEQSVSWTFTVEEDGLYEIALKVLQDDNEGLPVYRKISIDGEVPYEEFLEYKFEYSTDWYSEVLSDADGNPYLVYLEAGEHELTLTAQLGDLAYVIERSENDAMVLSEIYRTVTKITGTDPDVNYEYNLYRQLPELSAQLTEVADSIEVTAEILNQICNMTTPEESTYRSIVSTLREFAEDVDKIPRNLTDLENAQSNLGTYVTSIDTSPLQIDYLEVMAPEDEFVVEKSNFFERAYVTAVNFVLSFVKDYDAIGVTTADDEETVVLEVWVGTGSEWGEILKELIDSEFTPQTGIYVNLTVMPTSQLTTSGSSALLLSINSGTSPDVVLSLNYAQVSEYAFRDAAVDLTQFEDFDEVASWFYDDMLTPYKYLDGIYGLPETMDFSVLIYRKDLIAELGIELPDTWTELYEEVLPVLYENSMTFCYPVDTSASSATPSSLGGFTTFLLQKGGTFYTDNGKASALDTAEAYQAFKEWTELYTQYDIDEASDLFTRLRTGESPMGISGYSTYLKLLYAAPELYGRWGIALVPGTENEDGTINRTTGTMSSTANFILSNSEYTEEAWEFLKWYMSEDTQVSYGRQLEAVIGESARWNTANVNAFYRLPWKSEDQEVIQETLANAQEQYIVPGGYFTSRHVINAWNSVVTDFENARDVLEEAVEDINKELQKKVEEFGLENVDVIQN